MSTDRSVSTVMYAEDLVRRVCANEPRASDELYTRYSPRVFGYLFQRLNGNAEEAEDLTADVFTRVYEKIDGFQPQGAPLSAWVFRIAHKKLIDSVRRRRGRPRWRSRTRPRWPRRRSSAQSTSTSRSSTLSGVGAAHQRAAAGDRAAVPRSKSLAETAAVVGRNEDAVKRLQARGLASLRRRAGTPEWLLARGPGRRGLSHAVGSRPPWPVLRHARRRDATEYGGASA